MEVSWSAIKTLINLKGNLQFVEDDEILYLFWVDGTLSISCKILKNVQNQDLEDFNTNYRATANKNLIQNDDDGAQIVRVKAAKKGWSFWAVPIEITTSTLSGSLYCKDSTGVNVPGITAKIYDSENTEITTAGLLNANLATCVKTVIDFEPPFDYEIIGGSLRINSNPAQDVRLWIVGAPDIPAQFGGSKEFASGVNLKFMAPEAAFEIDGRVTKALTYNAVTHQGKMRIILKHPAGLALNMQIMIHIYRQ
jgi:hypothetical protein